MNKISLEMAKEAPLGAILYRGASQINGTKIVCIAIGLAGKGSQNTKTGPMVQTHILVDKIPPTKALWTGADKAVCGNCIHRWKDGLGSCYVNVANGPFAVYNAYKNGRYLKNPPEDILRDRLIRLGAYGDPTAVPISVWNKYLKHAKNWTGYTHQWKKAFARPYKKYCMASADSAEEAILAHKMGWRTFRVRASLDDPLLPNEFICPASNEASKRLTCATCMACNGGNPLRASPAIVVHGTSWKQNNFKEYFDDSTNR